MKFQVVFEVEARLVVFLKGAVGNAADQIGGFEVGVDLDGPGAVADRVTKPVHLQVDKAAIPVTFEVARIDQNRLGVVGKRFLVSLVLHEGVSPIEEWPGVVGGDFDCSTKIENRLGVVLFFLVGSTSVEISGWVLGVDFEDAVAISDRFGKALLEEL